MNMNNEQIFEISIDGSDYRVEISGSGARGHVTILRDRECVLTDASGYCNPLETLWSDWRYQSVHGAARAAMEQKHIKDFVISEIEAHKEFCAQQIEEAA